MPSKPVALLLGAVTLAALVLSGCTSATISGSWMNEQYLGKPLGNVLVLGASQNDLTRRIYEHDMVERLGKLGIKAQSAYALLPEQNPVEKEAVLKLAGEHGIDSVLITKLVRKKRETETRTYTTGNVYYAPRYGYPYPTPYYRYPYYNNWYGYYDGFGATTSTYTYEYVLLSLESNLYDIEKEELIWTTALEAMHESKVTDTIKDINKVTLQQMQKDGLIRR